MKRLVVDKNGFGRFEEGKVVFEVVKVDGLWNLSKSDYSGKYVSMFWVAENKKRLSTIQKYAKEYGLEIVEA